MFVGFSSTLKTGGALVKNLKSLMFGVQVALVVFASAASAYASPIDSLRIKAERLLSGAQAPQAKLERLPPVNAPVAHSPQPVQVVAALPRVRKIMQPLVEHRRELVAEARGTAPAGTAVATTDEQSLMHLLVVGVIATVGGVLFLLGYRLVKYVASGGQPS
jgi:hypothetical protein